VAPAHPQGSVEPGSRVASGGGLIGGVGGSMAGGLGAAGGMAGGVSHGVSGAVGGMANGTRSFGWCSRRAYLQRYIDLGSRRVRQGYYRALPPGSCPKLTITSSTRNVRLDGGTKMCSHEPGGSMAASGAGQAAGSINKSGAAKDSSSRTAAPAQTTHEPRDRN